MDKDIISALLGRPLTPTEDTNFNLYIDIAEQNLENLICSPIEEVEETRKFSTRDGFKTAFVDIFWDVTEVKLDDKVTTDYQVRQWDNQNGSWFNSLVFEDYLKGKDIEVTASWGFEPVSDASSLPLDLQQVLAGLFGLITKKNKHDGSIHRKQVEDFRIELKDVDLNIEFYKLYGSTLAKYSLCTIPNFIQGKKC